MSRSNNTELVNPALRFYEWMGSKGCLKYFDKTKGEKGENVEVPLPFSFLVLDRLATIKGFSDADQSGFWSNEVRNTKTDALVVRTKKGTVFTGLYSDMAHILNQGASYCQSVYIAFYDTQKELQIGNLQLHGSSIGAWIDACKGKNIYKFAITISEALPKKKGATNYFEPVFKFNPNVSEETNNKAIELDKQLQEYFTTYFSRNNTQQREIDESINAEKQVSGSNYQQNNASFNAQKPADYSGVNAQLNEDQFSQHNSEVEELVDALDDLPF